MIGLKGEVGRDQQFHRDGRPPRRVAVVGTLTVADRIVSEVVSVSKGQAGRLGVCKGHLKQGCAANDGGKHQEGVEQAERKGPSRPE